MYSFRLYVSARGESGKLSLKVWKSQRIYLAGSCRNPVSSISGISGLQLRVLHSKSKTVFRVGMAGDAVLTTDFIIGR